MQVQANDMDVVAVRSEIVELLRRQLEALDSPQGLTEEKLMECYHRQNRVQELRDQLQAISDRKQADDGFLLQSSMTGAIETPLEATAA